MTVTLALIRHLGRNHFEAMARSGWRASLALVIPQSLHQLQMVRPRAAVLGHTCLSELNPCGCCPSSLHVQEVTWEELICQTTTLVCSFSIQILLQPCLIPSTGLRSLLKITATQPTFHSRGLVMEGDFIW